MRRTPVLTGLLAALLAACTTTDDRTSTAAGGDPAPLPYTAEQIRAAHPDGTLVRFRMQQPLGTLVQCMRFENGDADGVDVVTWRERESGEPVGTPTTQRSRWSELRDHARFATGSATRQREQVTVPGGTFDCWHYTVAGETETAPVSHFYFADTKPGPPVLLVARQGDDEVMRMELLAYTPGR